MESFMLAVSAVLPLLIYMTVGYAVRTAGIFTTDHFRALNNLIFRLFLPLSLFFNVYQADLGDTMQPDLFAFVGISILVSFVAVYVVIHKIIPNRIDAATITQGIYRSNFVLFGTCMASSLCDEAGAALVSMLAAMVVPMINALAVILFEIDRGGKIRFGQLLRNIFKNPLVIAGIAGAVCSLSGIKIPSLLASPLLNLGNIATPLALVTLGGILSFESMRSHKKYLIISSLGRLFIVPFIVLLAAIALGYHGDPLVAILAAFGAPTAVASAPMAQTMGGNGELAGEIVATTSVACIVTIFLFVFALSKAGLLL